MQTTILIIIQDLTVGAYLNTLLSKRFKNITVVQKHYKCVDIIEKVSEYSPDIVFCEIDHSENEVFGLFSEIPIDKSNIIFLLKAENPAFKAIQFFNLHYLIKPFSPKELTEVMERVLSTIEEKLDKKNNSKSKSKISLSTHKGYTLVDPSNIVYINSSGNYCTVLLNNGEKITLTKLLGEFELMLPEENFIRVHQSFIVNIANIAEVVNVDGVQIILNSGVQIPVARRRKKELFNILGI